MSNVDPTAAILEIRRTAQTLLATAAQLEEELCALSGRRVMDVRFADSRSGERVYLVTMVEDGDDYQQVRPMAYPNLAHPEANTTRPGESWRHDGFTFTMEGLFDRSAKLDEDTTRYVEVTK